MHNTLRPDGTTAFKLDCERAPPPPFPVPAQREVHGKHHGKVSRPPHWLTSQRPRHIERRVSLVRQPPNCRRTFWIKVWGVSTRKNSFYARSAWKGLEQAHAGEIHPFSFEGKEEFYAQQVRFNVSVRFLKCCVSAAAGN